MKIDPTVFIVDDEHAMRKSLTQLVRSVHLPVEAFDSAEKFLAAFVPHHPGCLVLDLRMPAISGLELQQTLLARRISIPIIVLTGYGDVPTAVQTLKAGAFDFVEKPFQNHRFLDSIQAALRQDHEIRTRQVRQAKVEARLATLTPGEKEVLDRMMAGHGYKSIAKELDISYKTVQARRAQIMKKMETDDLPGLMHMLFTAPHVISAA